MICQRSHIFKSCCSFLARPCLHFMKITQSNSVDKAGIRETQRRWSFTSFHFQLITRGSACSQPKWGNKPAGVSLETPTKLTRFQLGASSHAEGMLLWETEAVSWLLASGKTIFLCLTTIINVQNISHAGLCAWLLFIEHQLHHISCSLHASWRLSHSGIRIQTRLEAGFRNIRLKFSVKNGPQGVEWRLYQKAQLNLLSCLLRFLVATFHNNSFLLKNLILHWKKKKKFIFPTFTLEKSSLASLLLALPLHQQHITWTKTGEPTWRSTSTCRWILLMPFGFSLQKGAHRACGRDDKHRPWFITW